MDQAIERDVEEPGGAPRRPRLPPALRRLVRVLAFFLVLHYLLLPQLAGAEDSLSVLRSVQPLLVLAGVAAEAGSLVACAQFTRSLLPAADRPGLLAILRMQLAMLAASRVIPGGSAAGAPIGYRLLRKLDAHPSDAAFMLGAQAVGSAVVVAALLLGALVASIPTRGADLTYIGVAGAAAAILMVAALLVAGMARGTHTADRLVHAIGRRVRFVDADAVSGQLHMVVGRIHVLAQDRRRLARTIGWSSLQWLLDAASLWIFLFALGTPVSPDALLIAFCVANVTAAIPLTPGGVGIYEAVLTSSLVGFGVPRAEAIIGVLAYRVFSFWLQIPIGALAYLSAEADTALPRARADALDDAYTSVASTAEGYRAWARRHGIGRRRRG